MNTLKPFLSVFLLAFFFMTGTNVRAQNFDQAGPYMTYISQQYRQITSDFWSYTSAVAHGKSAKKVDSRRTQLIQTVKAGSQKIKAMPPYKGDKSLRDSAVAFLNMTYSILTDDYGKIVNLEEVAEQSYDAMEAYLLAQELANKKQDEAGKRLDEMQESFAKKYEVNLVSNENDELSNKVKIANQVSDYHKKIYLIFFKSYKQEMYVMDAINNKNVNAIEQNKATLLKFSEEGIAKLDTMKAFNGDKSLVLACRQMLEFYQKECKEKFPTYTDYLLKAENFDKTKKAFEAKKESARTQADVDQFNKAVNEINAASAQYNAVNNELNQNRSKLIDSYNKTSQAFLDKHTPKYK